MPTPIKHAFLAATALLTAGAMTPAHAQIAFAATPIPNAAGSTTPIGHWLIQDSAKAQQGGAEISTNGFPTKDWYPVSGRATVMTGLLENGVYKNVFYSDNLRAVQVPGASGNHFVVPWWYRSEFTLPADAKGLHTLIRSNGIIADADLWVNGHPVADHAALAGAYPVHELDVTRLLHAGVNTLALRVHPADPRMALTTSWVDWNPAAPDDNMGPWRGVDIVQSGPVALRYPQAIPSLALPGLAHADLTVTVEAENLDTVAHDATITGTVAGVALRQTVHLAPGQTQKVSFSPKTTPGLALDHPKIWWPVGMGEHPLYQLAIGAKVDGTLSDTASTTFGIRSVTSILTKQGYRQFLVNGKPLLIRGAGWAPDIFLRQDPARLEAEFSYVRNLGLNTLRLEGKLEDQRFYDLADRDGILILAGWECCDKWESGAQTGGAPWDAHDLKVAEDSMASEARLLRNHPSVIGFLIGSDNAPPPAVAKMYVDTLHAAGWNLPVIAAANKQGTAETGPSGMKMEGPYDWVPPAYWYANQFGGAFGFDSEVSAGATIPLQDDLDRMLSPTEQEALWKHPEQRQYHAAVDWSPFAMLVPLNQALTQRYGPISSLRDFVVKAQLDNYENVRAQFEAFNAHMDAADPSTGVIYWMLNNAWPSLHWHLYDYYMNPAGAYFGAKKANEPLHIQYAYDSNAIVLVNHTLADAHGLQAHVRVRDLDGSIRYEKRLPGIELPGNHTQPLETLPRIAGLSRTYFVELDLATADGTPLSRNVYWLSTQADELNWAGTNWYTTPVTRYADMRALASLPAATSDVHATTRRDGNDDVTTVTLSVPASSKAVALFQHVSIRRGAHGDPALPILWSDNDVTLWPGETAVLTARYAAQAGAAPVVEVGGWNVATQSVPATSQETAH